ncbi:MAG: cell surface receptor domain protein [Solirubrobacterales bacterium]|nr:cell surface receptor domain protein [Solirubrobacterales bacterium]
MRHSMRLVAMTLTCGLGGALASASVARAAAPALSSIAPNNGPAAGGTSVTVSGSGFTAGATVRFGAAAATGVSVLSSGSITATSPAGGGSEPVNVTVTDANGSSAATPRDQFAYDPAPASAWLGLNGNSSGVKPERLRELAAEGVVYDRSGAPGLDWVAGELPSQGGRTTAGGHALATSIGAGMIPDVAIEYRAYHGDYQPDPNFPQERTKGEEAEGRETIKRYVAGFISSAKAIHEKYPSAIFEPMNEPWGYTTPQYNAAEYANVLARLLPEAKAAGIPLSSIYVGATGKECPAQAPGGECVSDGWVPAMYAAQPSLQTQVQGWYLHPYGPPKGVGEDDGVGIESVPLVQQTMTSGQSNVIVSEVGYCAVDVNEGRGCSHTEHSRRAAKHLRQMLETALAYHEAGWLRALLIYSRTDGGWAMQLGDGTLTAQGQALQKFASALQPAVRVKPDANPFDGPPSAVKLTQPI